MELKYINYFSLLPTDNAQLTNPEYHDFREKYRFFKLIGRYINASIKQYNQIYDWFLKQHELGSRTVLSDEAVEVELIFADIHFLLISMDKCYKYEQKLYQQLNLPQEAVKLQRSKKANTIRLMRNDFEHSEENINKISANEKYELPKIFQENGWSWYEYQSATISNGAVKIRNNTLLISEDMFNDIISHYHLLISYLKKELQDILLDTVVPTSDELAAIAAYKAGDPDYQPSISQEDLMKELGIN